jgi:hypothetical protein
MENPGIDLKSVPIRIVDEFITSASYESISVDRLGSLQREIFDSASIAINHSAPSLRS